MVRVLLAASALVAAIALGLAIGLGVDRGRGDGTPHAVTPGGTTIDTSFLAGLKAEREAREALELEVEALRASILRLMDAPRQSALAPPGAAGEAERDAHWYLEQYVRSFDGGGSGSEYFRLAVQAYVPELVEEVARHVESRAAHPILRARLATLLGDGRLAGNRRAIAALLGVLAPGSAPELARAAVGGLRTVAGETELDALIGRVFQLDDLEARQALVALALDLAGPRPNGVVAGLLRTAPDEQAEHGLVALMRPADIDGALECFELVSYRDRGTRLSGAHRTHEFRDARTAALVEAWAARETDEEVRAALLRAKQRLETVPAWAAEQATGAPNVADASADSQEAWAPGQADGGAEWLELDYDPPRRAHAVEVHEVCSAGALARVVLIDESGAAHQVWKGSDPLGTPGIAAISFDATPYRVRRVRLELDTTRASGWNEVDAVRLVGPDGAAWAKGARASSSFGQTMQLLRDQGYVTGD